MKTTNWHEKVRRDLPAYKEILGWNDLFQDWERNRMPASAAAVELRNGLELLYGTEAPLANKFFKRAIEIADRSFAERKFESRLCEGGFPKNRGLAERVRQYARVLLGKNFDPKALHTGAQDVIDYFKASDDPVDSQMHAYWLAAVRMTLIAGDPARALEMITEASSLKWHQTEADLLVDIARAAVNERPIRDPKLLARLDILFDNVRSPKWRGSAKIFDEPDEQRFELAVIRYKYFASKDGTIDWDDVIESIRK